MTVPPDPTAGVVHVYPGALSETNVVFGGSVSLTVIVAASLGPAFAVVIVYVTSLFAPTAAGPLFVIERSAAAFAIVTDDDAD